VALYIVSTPIGNLSDITYRAVKILQDADCICAEDTRVSSVLLRHYGIDKQMISYHDHNEERVTPHLIERLKNGENIALITDAGTPGIADPAFYIVRASIRESIKVIPVPGASAVLSGLVASGLPCERYIFENFLPHKSAQRKRLFESLREESRTVVFYETPHRIVKVLTELNEILGSIRVVIARELTKMHEEFLRGTPVTLLRHFEQKTPRGEMVVMISTRKGLSETMDNDTDTCTEETSEDSMNHNISI
jgi:16S rRNA (cytidine1402-2'-O)-methyltransferase